MNAELPPHDPAASEPPAEGTSPGQSDALLSSLERAERVLYARVILAGVLFCAFVAFDVSAALTGKMHEHGWKLLVLFTLAILMLPRQPLSSAQLRQLPAAIRGPWLERAKRTHQWLMWARVTFLLSAIALFAGLPQLV